MTLMMRSLEHELLSVSHRISLFFKLFNHFLREVFNILLSFPHESLLNLFSLLSVLCLSLRSLISISKQENVSFISFLSSSIHS